MNALTEPGLLQAERIAAAPALLRIEALHAWYGESHVLHGVELDVREGELVTLLGRNGAGRTTTLRAVMGLVGRRAGRIVFRGHDLIAAAPHVAARAGIGYCPEERGIFAALSAEENLLLPPRTGSAAMSLAQIYELFPNLLERGASPGSRLSGGEQQMLALARILRTGARLLLLDEVTEGLAPVIVKALGAAITKLKRLGYTIVLVEQNFRFAAPLADRHFVLERGRVAATVRQDELAQRAGMLHRLLGV
jgi:branched-chain amino acid transport system ATP-binding protein